MDWFPYAILLGFFVYAWRINRTTGVLPDQLNFAFVFWGILISAFLPSVVGGSVWWQGIALAGLGAVVSFVHGLLVAKVAKLRFGKKTLVYPCPVPFGVTVFPDHAVVTVNGAAIPLEDLFTKMSDVAVVSAESLTVRDSQNVAEYGRRDFQLRYGWLEVGNARHEMVPGRAMFGVISALTYQRDAIGFGALKMLMVPGAFLGWKAAIFVLWVAIAVGMMWALTLRWMGRPSPEKAQLEPFLIVGMAAWLIWNWPH